MEQAELTKNHYLLVSDSNETGNQYDSKKLSLESLMELAESELFKTHLPALSNYLTIDQYNNYVKSIEKDISNKERAFLEVNNKENTNKKFKVVDGQVILLHVDSLDEEAVQSPEDYIRKHWNITSEYVLINISSCMLRGMTEVISDSINLPGNNTVNLVEENMPNHMHNSSITKNAKIETISGNTQTQSATVSGKTKYDVFYNDSNSTGLDNNELEGVVDKFTPNSFGQSNNCSHNNLPKYTKFYAFVVSKVGEGN